MASVAVRDSQDEYSWLYEQIRFCMDHALDAVLQTSHEFDYVVLGREQLYFRRESILPEAVRRNFPVTFRHKTIGDQPEIRNLALEQGRPLSELIWSCAWHMSESSLTGLLNGCRRDDVVHLKNWPNLTRLPANEQAPRIAALFTMRPTSLVLATRILDIDERQVFRFYSACRYAGLVRLINRADVMPVLPRKDDHKHIGVIRQLFGRFASNLLGK